MTRARLSGMPCSKSLKSIQLYQMSLFETDHEIWASFFHGEGIYPLHALRRDGEEEVLRHWADSNKTSIFIHYQFGLSDDNMYNKNTIHLQTLAQGGPVFKTKLSSIQAGLKAPKEILNKLFKQALQK